MISLRDIFEDSPWEADEFPFYRGIQFGFLGIILFYFSYHIAARHVQFSSLSPVLQLLIAHLPFIVCGTGGALLGLRKSLQEYGWRKVLICQRHCPVLSAYLQRAAEVVAVGRCRHPAQPDIFLFLRNLGFQHFPKQSLEAFVPTPGYPSGLLHSSYRL